jgi:hypothetical protein
MIRRREFITLLLRMCEAAIRLPRLRRANSDQCCPIMHRGLARHWPVQVAVSNYIRYGCEKAKSSGYAAPVNLS